MQGADGGRLFGCPAPHPLGHPLISAAAVVDTLGELPVLLTAPPIEARGVRHSHIYSSTFFKATEVCLACMARRSPEVRDLMAPGKPSTTKGGSHWLDVPLLHVPWPGAESPALHLLVGQFWEPFCMPLRRFPVEVSPHRPQW